MAIGGASTTPRVHEQQQWRLERCLPLWRLASDGKKAGSVSHGMGCFVLVFGLGRTVGYENGLRKERPR